MNGAPLVLGADIGGSTVDVVVVDASGGVCAGASRPTASGDQEQILTSTVTAIREALDGGTVALGDVGAVGIGVPGQVDQTSGWVRLAMNLNIGAEGFPIGPKIEAEFGLRTAIENDVRAAALGAWQALDRSDVRSLAYMGIGTGISAGLVIDGRLHRGRTGMAGEIGHVALAGNGAPCRCGLRGCLEAVAAGPAIARRWPKQRGAAADDLFTAAARGDSEATSIAGEVADHLAAAVQLVAFAYEPDLVVLGGGVGSVGDPLVEAIRRSLQGSARRSQLVAHVVAPERLTSIPKGVPIGAIGAAAVARQRFGGDGGGVHPT